MIVSTALVTNLIGVSGAILALTYAYFKWIYTYWDRKNFPFLEPSIPFGNLSPPHRRVISIGDEFVDKYKQTKAKGWDYCGIFLILNPSLLVTNLDLIKNILAKDFNHFVDRGTYVNERDEPIGAHIFAIGGVKWRNLRTKLSPTFTSGRMRQMFQTLVDCGLIMEHYLQQEVRKSEAIDIKNVLSCFATDIIGSCAFGLECNTFNQPDSPFRLFGKKIFELTPFQMLKLTFAFNMPALARALKICMLPKDVNKFFTKVVKDTVNYREENGIKRNDFMQMLIDIRSRDEEEPTGDGKTLTIDEIVAQSFVFFVAGFETSSTTMTFALFELATHEDIQTKVREEINRVLKEHDNKMTYDCLSQMTYTGQVIDETLRKYPPVPVITRVCVEDYRLPDSDLIIPKGTKVMIPVKGIHYDEEYYQQPDEFDPERFSEDFKKQRHQYAHIPFGEGPRICIGMRFGIMTTKIGLICVLRNFKVTLGDRTTIPLKMTVTSFIPTTEGGVWLNLEKV